MLVSHSSTQTKPAYKHNRSEMVAVLGPYEALPYYIHTSQLTKSRVEMSSSLSVVTA
jgi:hypothetical protein